LSLRDVAAFAATALQGHRLRSGLSLLGVAIGVASVVMLTSLGEGARLYVTGEFATLGSNLIFVIPGKTETTGVAPLVSVAPHDLTLGDMEAIRRRVPEVRRLAPIVVGGAPLSYGDRRREVTVAGTTAEFRDVMKLRMGIGSYLPAGDAERGAAVCVLGSKLQKELFGSSNPLGETVRIADERFRVIGILAPRGLSIGMDLDEIVHIPVGRAFRLFDQTTLRRIVAEARSNESVPAAGRAIVSVLRERHGEDDVTIITQDSVISTFSRIFGLLTATLAGIAGISLTVAGIGIMNVMLVSVSERTREIGLLKAVGATSRQVVGVFLLEAAILSTLGGLVGLAVAFTAARLFSALYPSFPLAAPDWAIAAAVLVSACVGIAFGALPARRAAGLDPVVALSRR
jgi:putative ABC transport system permease protein